MCQICLQLAIFLLVAENKSILFLVSPSGSFCVHSSCYDFLKNVFRQRLFACVRRVSVCLLPNSRTELAGDDYHFCLFCIFCFSDIFVLFFSHIFFRELVACKCVIWIENLLLSLSRMYIILGNMQTSCEPCTEHSLYYSCHTDIKINWM